MPVDPIIGVAGVGASSEVGSGQTSGPQGAGGEGFGGMLAKQLGNLEALQQDANEQVLALATGQADDVSSVVMAVERASLSMQLASQIRNKGVEAYQEIWRLQV